MATLGRKFIEGQNKKLRKSVEDLIEVNNDLAVMNGTLNDELKKSQDEKKLLTDQKFFKAFKQLLHIRKK